VIGIAVAVAAGGRAHAEQARKPTPAEISAAGAAGVAQRWERAPAGVIFPAAIRYTSDLFTHETASRVGIAPGTSCAAALDGTLRRLAESDGCVAGMRADYTDELNGSVYTLGVLAFPTAGEAARFYNAVPAGGYPATGLHALAIGGTAAALVRDGARQASAAQAAGPYVVLAVAGYADGRPALAGGERRDSVFDPASQLVSAIAAPLARPVAVRCGSSEWACDLTGSNTPAPPSSIVQIRPAELKTLDQIHAPAAWRVSQGSGVTVAVLDTGVDGGAPDLAGVVRFGPDFTAGADPPGFQPPHLHGTYIASLIAGHGSGPGDALGVIGVAPEARILSVRVILDDGEPGMTANDQGPRFADAIGKGIYYAVRHGARVINMSLGSEQSTAYLRAAVAYAVQHGVVVVASAGNNGTSSGFAPYIYPASFTGVIAAAAVDSSGRRASFSEQNAAVVLAAPGVNVIGAGPNDEYIEGDGTSPAAALVSGVAALIRSRYPRLSPALVEQALISGAAQRPSGGYSTGTGFGEVNAVTALQAAARLAATRPAAVLSPAARFVGSQSPAPIQVTHRDFAGITGYYAAAAGGGLVAVVALALIPVLALRSRRASPAAPGPQPGSFPQFQQPGQVPQPARYTQHPWAYQSPPSQPQPYQPPPYPQQSWQPQDAWSGQSPPSPPQQPPYRQDSHQSYRPQPSFQPRQPFQPHHSPGQPSSPQQQPNQQPSFSPGPPESASNPRNDPDRPNSWFDPL
jgi:type VII secretion-associated serine protease mycosin